MDRDRRMIPESEVCQIYTDRVIDKDTPVGTSVYIIDDDDKKIYGETVSTVNHCGYGEYVVGVLLQDGTEHPFHPEDVFYHEKTD